MCALHPTIGKCNHCPSLRRDISNLFRLSEGDYERFGCKFIISGNAERSVGTEKDRGNGWTIGLQFISNKSSGGIGWVSEHVLLGRGGWTRPWTAPPKTCRASHTPLHSALRGSGSKSLEWGGKLAFSPSLVFCALLSPSEEKSTVNYFKRNRGRIAHPVELSGSFKCADLKKKFFFSLFFWRRLKEPACVLWPCSAVTGSCLLPGASISVRLDFGNNTAWRKDIKWVSWLREGCKPRLR